MGGSGHTSDRQQTRNYDGEDCEFDIVAGLECQAHTSSEIIDIGWNARGGNDVGRTGIVSFTTAKVLTFFDPPLEVSALLRRPVLILPEYVDTESIPFLKSTPLEAYILSTGTVCMVRIPNFIPEFEDS